MKLIIDISEGDYKWIKDHVMTVNEQRIANGIPLDDLRAEIDAIYKEDMECDGCSDMGMVLDIIDKYKGEQDENEHK